MEIKGFQVVEMMPDADRTNRILIRDVADLSPSGFDLKGTLESGQCFRWNETDAGRYLGIVMGHAVLVSLVEKKHLLIENAGVEDFSELWHDYFDLGTDYAPIQKKVDRDPFLHEAIRHSGGARMLRQDFEETLFSYILSSQNNIPRIKKLVESLCGLYGTEVRFISHQNGMDTEYQGHAFPSARVLSERFCNENNPSCRAAALCSHPFGGYRCPYIKKTASILLSGEVPLDFTFLSSCSVLKAREILCRFPGVGEKVADCVLLYSGIRKDICPIDVWVEKTIREIYLHPGAGKKEIRAFTESYFGEDAGIAQLWFFNYARNIRNRPVTG